MGLLSRLLGLSLYLCRDNSFRNLTKIIIWRWLHLQDRYKLWVLRKNSQSMFMAQTITRPETRHRISNAYLSSFLGENKYHFSLVRYQEQNWCQEQNRPRCQDTLCLKLLPVTAAQESWARPCVGPCHAAAKTLLGHHRYGCVESQKLKNMRPFMWVVNTRADFTYSDFIGDLWAAKTKLHFHIVPVFLFFGYRSSHYGDIHTLHLNFKPFFFFLK